MKTQPPRGNGKGYLTVLETSLSEGGTTRNWSQRQDNSAPGCESRGNQGLLQQQPLLKF